MHTGRDYLLNIQNPLSRIFTVRFQSKQANSSENVIVVADDDIVEGTEAFRLRIVAADFFGQADAIFRTEDGLTNTTADVVIEDNDCKFVNTPCIICLQTVTETNYGNTCAYIPVMHAPSPPTVVEVSWINSNTIQVREGEGLRLELFAQAFGLYTTAIEIGVICAPVDVGVPPGADTIPSTDTLEHAIIYHTSPICLQPSLTETFGS